MDNLMCTWAEVQRIMIQIAKINCMLHKTITSYMSTIFSSFEKIKLTKYYILKKYELDNFYFQRHGITIL